MTPPPSFVIELQLGVLDEQDFTATTPEQSCTSAMELEKFCAKSHMLCATIWNKFIRAQRHFQSIRNKVRDFDILIIFICSVEARHVQEFWQKGRHSKGDQRKQNLLAMCMFYGLLWNKLNLFWWVFYLKIAFRPIETDPSEDLNKTTGYQGWCDPLSVMSPSLVLIK